MITIVDYKMGNHSSVQKALNRLGAESIISSDPEVILSSDKLLLPGVGHFGKAMEQLEQLQLVEVLNEAVLIRKKKILGICLGMQLMTEFSEEGNCKGLGWIKGEVRKFQTTDSFRFKIPHSGWNNAHFEKASQLTGNIPQENEFYFIHSFFVKCADQKDILATTDYIQPFDSAFEKENIYGVQFHPEKSLDFGAALFKNFIQL